MRETHAKCVRVESFGCQSDILSFAPKLEVVILHDKDSLS